VFALSNFPDISVPSNFPGFLSFWGLKRSKFPETIFSTFFSIENHGKSAEISLTKFPEKGGDFNLTSDISICPPESREI
jgi:hypothetical protein